MEAILGFLGSKIGIFGMGVAIPLVFVAGKKFLPKYFGGIVAKLLGKGLSEMDEIKDPVEKILVQNIAVAVVKWAEYKIPDKGQGRARFETAAAKLCAMLPFLKGRDKDLADIIENAVVAMDDELKRVEPIQPGEIK